MWKEIFLSCLALACTHGSERFVQLMEWRFEDVANECENFLGKNGYTGVRLSPVTENAVLEGRPWFERYQPFSYKIMSRSGNADDFKKMCERCSKVGVKVFVDVLLNHMTANLSPAIKGTAGSEADTANKIYPGVPYSTEHFHTTCDIGSDYMNATKVRVCELVGLHDLDQKQEYVINKMVDHLNELIDLGASGFRLDAAKHMYPEDLENIMSRVKPLADGRKPQVYQEVPGDGGPEAIHPADYFNIGMVTEFKYGSYMIPLKRNMKLSILKDIDNDMMDSSKAVVFIDNHDRQRNDAVNYKLPSLYKMVSSFMLAWPYGEVKKIMSSYDFATSDQGPPHNEDWSIKPVTTLEDGQCGNGWVCEHRWPEIAAMVRFAQVVDGTNATGFTVHSDDTISFQRSGKGFFLLSGAAPQNMNNIQTGLAPGKYCDIISDSVSRKRCSGAMVVVKEGGLGDIMFPRSNLNYTILAIHTESMVE